MKHTVTLLSYTNSTLSSSTMCYLQVSDGPAQSSTPAAAAVEPGVQWAWRRPRAATSPWAGWVNWAS